MTRRTTRLATLALGVLLTLGGSGVAHADEAPCGRSLAFGRVAVTCEATPVVDTPEAADADATEAPVEAADAPAVVTPASASTEATPLDAEETAGERTATARRGERTAAALAAGAENTRTTGDVRAAAANRDGSLSSQVRDWFADYQQLRIALNITGGGQPVA